MDIISRYGSEEFCILAPSLNREEAFTLFDNFRMSVASSKIKISDQQSIQITLSIGVTTDLSPDLDDMISGADVLLYQAKHHGRDCVVVR